jgi:hypothetical protein
MEFDKRLDEFKTIFRRSALPDSVRLVYEQILAFADARETNKHIASISSELAVQLGCDLDLLFPVPETESLREPQELLGQQRYDAVKEMLGTIDTVEQNAVDTILERISDAENELCIFPAPFHLSEEEETRSDRPGSVIDELLTRITGPVLLTRTPPRMPPDLYDRVVVIGSTLHNLLDLVRATAGLCPEQTDIEVFAFADERFFKSMRTLLDESTDLESEKTDQQLRQTFLRELKRKLRQMGEQLAEQYDITLRTEVRQASITDPDGDVSLPGDDPTLISVPTDFEDGGYEPAVLRRFFQSFTRTEFLTI